MGISDFLSRILETAGEPVDWREISKNGVTIITEATATATTTTRTTNDNNHHQESSPNNSLTSHIPSHIPCKRRRLRQNRPLRIGVDINAWIYKAIYGFGDMLGDARHLSAYGRADLYQEQQQGQQGKEQASSSSSSSSNNPCDDNRRQQDKDESIQGYIAACVNYVLKRLEALREDSRAEILVVLDGATPPMKQTEAQRRRQDRHRHEQARDKPVDPFMEDETLDVNRRTKAFRRAGAGEHLTTILQQLVVALETAHIAFLVAPYEADSQLAYLSHQNYIDLIVTEDSDLVAYGAKAILYKSNTNNYVNADTEPSCSGILLLQSALGCWTKTLRLADFTPAMLATLFVAVGCDYCDKLKGIGLVTASRIIQRAFLETKTHPLTTMTTTANATTTTKPSVSKTPSTSPPLCSNPAGTTQSPLSIVFQELYKHSYTSKFTKGFQRTYENQFLSALFMYQHPVVYDPIERRCFKMGLTPTTTTTTPTATGGGGGDPTLMEYVPYANLVHDVSPFFQSVDIVGPIPSNDIATKIAEGYYLKLGLSWNYVSKETKNKKDGDKDMAAPVSVPVPVLVPVPVPEANDSQGHGDDKDDDDDDDEGDNDVLHTQQDAWVVDQVEGEEEDEAQQQHVGYPNCHSDSQVQSSTIQEGLSSEPTSTRWMEPIVTTSLMGLSMVASPPMQDPKMSQSSTSTKDISIQTTTTTTTTTTRTTAISTTTKKQQSPNLLYSSTPEKTQTSQSCVGSM